VLTESGGSITLSFGLTMQVCDLKRTDALSASRFLGVIDVVEADGDELRRRRDEKARP
jgi:hypothetical protein